MLKINYHGKELELKKATYAEDDSFYIGLYDVEGESYINVTVNLCNPFLGGNIQFFNENAAYAKELKAALIQIGVLREDSCAYAQKSGFVTYKAYEFHKLEEMNDL